jgi:quinol monooxygenase YgiN
MLVIAGTISLDPEDRDAFLENAKAASAGTRTEEGNHEYVFSADGTDPGLVHLFELWDSEDRLPAHRDSEHMGAFGAANKGLRFTGRDIMKYYVSDSEPL